jgi:hypothetical protein
MKIGVANGAMLTAIKTGGSPVMGGDGGTVRNSSCGRFQLAGEMQGGRASGGWEIEIAWAGTPLIANGEGF